MDVLRDFWNDVFAAKHVATSNLGNTGDLTAVLGISGTSEDSYYKSGIFRTSFNIQGRSVHAQAFDHDGIPTSWVTSAISHLIIERRDS